MPFVNFFLVYCQLSFNQNFINTFFFKVFLNLLFFTFFIGGVTEKKIIITDMTDKQSNVYLKSCQYYNTLCEICVYLCEGENFLCTLYNS